MPFRLSVGPQEARAMLFPRWICILTDLSNKSGIVGMKIYIPSDLSS